MASIAIIHNHPIHYQHLLFCELAKRGLDFEVLFVAAFSGSRVEAPLPTRSEYSFSIGHAGSYEAARRDETAHFVWKALNRIRPVLVVISGYSDAAAWTAWLWSSLYQAKKILWAESNTFDHPRKVWRELPKRIFIKGCDFAHVYGTSSREYVEKLGMPRDRIQTKRAIANTVLFLNASDAKTEDPKAIRLLYCGRLSPEKNLAFLMRAFARLNQDVESPRLLLTIVGYGPLEHSLRDLAKELGISEIVDFAGGRHQADLPLIFRNFDALILPSISEPWGLVVNEAMLSGLAVAVSERCGCAADLVRPENGWIFSPEHEVALTALLEKIANTPRGVLKRMGQFGRSIAAEYSPENCAKAVIEMVACILHTPDGQSISIGIRS
jgi:glycosyltransferase involved in cell wall biosynthesis